MKILAVVAVSCPEGQETPNKAAVIKAVLRAGLVPDLRTAKSFVEDNMRYASSYMGAEKWTKSVEVILSAEQVAHWAIEAQPGSGHILEPMCKIVLQDMRPLHAIDLTR